MSVIDGVIAAEEDAIVTYRSLISAAREADDPVTEDLAIELLADEEVHRAEFRGFLQEYDGLANPTGPTPSATRTGGLLPTPALRVP